MTATCKWCSKQIVRPGLRPPVFCSLACKGEWQRTQKPLSRDRLFQLYVADGMGTYQIARLVGRDPKRVYDWLRGFGIPLRRREWDTTPGQRPFHDKSWLEREYLEKKRSAHEIAEECGVTENNVLFFLQKLGIPTRSTQEVRASKYWGALGPANPMFGKRGEESSNWRGGVTPERQAFYLSPEWKGAARVVRKRDKATCQRCGLEASCGIEMHVHHKVSFAFRPLRAEPSNLVLLCDTCHDWVHSRRNAYQSFIEVPPVTVNRDD